MPHCKKQMISFFLTTKCNLCCTYCYNRKERSTLTHQTLPLEIAKAGIDYFFETFPSRHIRFYGPGEPTQEFSLMKKITDYALNKSDKPITVELQTNGVFEEDVCEWISGFGDIVWISFDGPPDIQDHNRPINPDYSPNDTRSSVVIKKNIENIIKKSKRKMMIGARVTIVNDTIERQIEMINYFYEIGIKHVWNDPVFPEVGSVPVCNLDNRLHSPFIMNKYVDQYIEAYRYAKTKGMFYGSFLTCNFDGECIVHCRACTPVPHLTPDGFLSACDLVTFGNNAYHMDCFIYGKWNDKDKNFIFFQDKINMLKNRNVNNLPHCRECEAKFYCGGYCLGEVQNETGSLFGQKEEACRAIRRLLREIRPCDSYEYLHP